MFPILFSIGPLTIKTMSVFLVLAFLATSFIFWRRGREEHYREDQLFDGYFLAVLVGMVAARIGYIVLNLQVFGWSILQWFDIIGHPGFSGYIGLIISSIYLYRYAQRNKWDTFEILDFWATGTSLGAVFVFIGKFFEGTSIGNPTNLPIGITFPNLFEARHPVQLYYALFFVFLFWYLGWAEYHYRTFQWYRAGRKTAQTGYLVSVFIIMSSIFILLMSFLQAPSLQFWSVNIDQVMGIAMLIGGCLMLYVRSGRALPFTREQKKRRALQQRFDTQAN